MAKLHKSGTAPTASGERPLPPADVRPSAPRSRPRSLRSILFRYTLAPTLALAVLLCLVFTLQQMNDRRDLLLSHGRASAEQLIELIHLSSGHSFEERIEWLDKSLLALMLDRDMIRSIQLYRSDHGTDNTETFTLISSVGPRPRTTHSPDDLRGKQAHIHEDVDSLQVLHPLKGEGTNCWLVIELHRPYFLVGTYQVALIGLIGLILCALAALIWAVYLSEKASRHISGFRDTLRDIGSGHFCARVEAPNNLELAQFADEINQMAQNLADHQREYQESLHQSMEDLRQSLDAMEEQNIELELARKKAVENSRVKSTFLANTSHEIRTPLNGIIGFTNLLLKTEVDELQQDYLQTILRSSESLLTTINDILDFSRIESGNLVFEHTPMNLGQVLEETLQILAPYAYEHNLELVPFIDPQLPPSQIGDPLRIKQILSNLVSNAIRCSVDGNISVRVSVQSGKESELITRINITDLGNRIDEAGRRELKQLLSSRRHQQQQQLSSNGMGLSIARSLIESMQGEIGISDGESGGFTYRLSLPLAVDRNRSAVTREQFPACRIMIADPNPMTRQQIVQLLHQWRAEPMAHNESQTLEPTLEQLWRHDALPDAVIIDTAFAGEEFDQFIATVQKLVDTFQCRIIVQGSPMDLRRCYDALRTRVLAFVGKPVAREGLLRALKRAVPHQSHPRPLTGSFPPLPWPTKPRVLVVDDYEANRLLMGELLRGQNIEAIIASNGEEAISLWREQQIDMIFMDIQMPGMDGIAATARIRSEESNSRTPIIALTAHVGAEEKSRLLSAGLDDYLSKPVSEAQLNHTIKRWMEMRVQPPQEATPRLESRPVDISESLKLSNKNPELGRDLLQMLLKGLYEDEEELGRLYRAGDHRGLFERVHRLHGGCCYCGVPRLRDATEKLQEQLRPYAAQEDASQNHAANQDSKVDDQLYRTVIQEVRALRDWAADQDLAALFGLESAQDPGAEPKKALN
ncbi:response regulator [Microbulbifer celer]|uniref:histidine kinase n=1 Tax=Microbulbifer celer TaxID=435905 RepID=A0ABW3U5Z9_9GAMM|nr:response regulator [Microbulbifer celer]UFN58454.1 response regulator [Microbulbifer celer]